MLYRAAIIMAAKGGTLANITVGDVTELLDAQAGTHASPAAGSVLFYRLLHQLGILSPAAQGRPCPGCRVGQAIWRLDIGVGRAGVGPGQPSSSRARRRGGHGGRRAHVLPASLCVARTRL